MDITEAIQTAQELLNLWTSGMSTPDLSRLDVALAPKDLKPAVESYRKLIGAIFRRSPASITRRCPLHRTESSLPKKAAWKCCIISAKAQRSLTLRVSVPYARPVIPSICEILPYATLYEREAIEMFGATFRGTPNTDHFVLPEDWPGGVYPLRKSFTGFNKPHKACDRSQHGS